MKKAFTTGLALFLPAFFTIIILQFLVNLFTKPFLNFMQKLLIYLGLENISFLFFTSKLTITLLSQILILAALVSITILVGFLGKTYLVRYFLIYGDKLMHRIPLLNKIYKTIQDTVNTLIGSETSKFSRVVLVPYPHSETWCIGLVTKEEMGPQSEIARLSVFVPGTPNPSVGYMLQFSKSQVITLDLTVEEALKCVVSGGITLKS